MITSLAYIQYPIFNTIIKHKLSKKLKSKLLEDPIEKFNSIDVSTRTTRMATVAPQTKNEPVYQSIGEWMKCDGTRALIKEGERQYMENLKSNRLAVCCNALAQLAEERTNIEKKRADLIAAKNEIQQVLDRNDNQQGESLCNNDDSDDSDDDDDDDDDEDEDDDDDEYVPNTMLYAELFRIDDKITKCGRELRANKRETSVYQFEIQVINK